MTATTSSAVAPSLTALQGQPSAQSAPRISTELAINVIRSLAMDAPHAARSGHQGTAMSLAPLAHVLWSQILKYDPTCPDWPDRDRFILSCGHASILLYSMLFLSGYGLTLEDLRNFRQWGSRTPGHPEASHPGASHTGASNSAAHDTSGLAPGVEVTTGPLGQGFANAVGMGMAERWLRKKFGSEVCDHRIFTICSDGDLAEGVSHEAASLAGHQKLGRLICIYDDNRISIDGEAGLWLSDDPAKRFAAYGWHVANLGEISENPQLLREAIENATLVEEAPSLLVLRTKIGFPSPTYTDTAAAHGYALLDEEIATTKELLGLSSETFDVPQEAKDAYKPAAQRGKAARQAWESRLANLSARNKRLAGEFKAALGETHKDWQTDWQARLAELDFPAGTKIATRSASGSCLNVLADYVPGLVAGGADLTGNTGTKLKGAEVLSAGSPDGTQVYFGVREHAMAASMVGMAHHGGLLPVGGTFLVFSDYMRPAVRLAAMSSAKVVFVWTHDSVAVGEDGPTHQPIEHIAALRAIPGLCVIRPADANETAGAWQVALQNDGPTALILTRQAVPVLEATSRDLVIKGAYVLAKPDNCTPDLVLVGTGSEVALCVDAADQYQHQNQRQSQKQGGQQQVGKQHSIQIVSMPSWELFEQQPETYQREVFPAGVPSMSVEAGSTQGWHRFVDEAWGIDRFGASAPGDRVMSEYGMTAEKICEKITRLLSS